MENHLEKENIILQLPERHLVFLDEVGDPFLHWNLKDYEDPSLFPAMTVTAVMVARAVYESVLMPGLDEIKERFFTSKDIFFTRVKLGAKTEFLKFFLTKKHIPISSNR